MVSAPLQDDFPLRTPRRDLSGTAYRRPIGPNFNHPWPFLGSPDWQSQTDRVWAMHDGVRLSGAFPILSDGHWARER